MTRHAPALLALSIVAVAGWTYNVNYDTRAAFDQLSALRAEIAGEREALQVLRVEWAYLNAPERLATLVAEHNEALGLTPLVPEDLAIAAAIPYPPREAPVAAPAPEALLAAAEPTLPAGQSTAQSPDLEREPGAASESVRLAALSQPGGTGRPSAPARRALAGAGAVLAPVPAVVGGASPSAETVPVALEAAIAAALIEVGVTTESTRSAGSPGGSLAALAASHPGVISVASGVPVPEARPAPWSRP